MASKLYRVQYDNDPDFVEAESFGEAVELWRAFLVLTNPPGDITDADEPESVELMVEKPVIRREHKSTTEVNAVSALKALDNIDMPF